MQPATIKSDLVIGMTLAEIFLLILFVVWYTQGPKEGPDVQKLEKENAELKSEVARQQEKIAEYEREHEWWLTNFSTKPPASVEELETILRSKEAEQIRQDLARGLPPCDRRSNVLAEVVVHNGATHVNLTPGATNFFEWAASSNRSLPSAGTVVDNPQRVNEVLAAVDSFYTGRVRDQKPCRFDYRLVFSTPEDYYEARERFERAFYLAGKRRITR